jgi:hypothetical protein
VKVGWPGRSAEVDVAVEVEELAGAKELPAKEKPPVVGAFGGAKDVADDVAIGLGGAVLISSCTFGVEENVNGEDEVVLLKGEAVRGGAEGDRVVDFVLVVACEDASLTFVEEVFVLFSSAVLLNVSYFA